MTPEVAAAILNVPVDADRETITRAYNLRARMTHPDRFAGASERDLKAATAEFVRVTEARDVLQRPRASQERTSPRTETPHRAADSNTRARSAGSPINFEQFVARREEAAWQAATRRPPEPTHPYPAEQWLKTPKKPHPARWWWLGSGLAVVAAVIVISVTSTALGNLNSVTASPDDNGWTQTLDGGGGVLIGVDGTPGGWSWGLTPTSECPAARVTVSFTDTEDGDPLETYTDTVELRANNRTEYSVPVGTSDRQYASLDGVTCQ